MLGPISLSAILARLSAVQTTITVAITASQLVITNAITASQTVITTAIAVLQAWLLRSIGLIHSGAVTTYTNATTFASTDLTGYGANYFKGWYVRVSWDAGGAAAAPQSEYAAVTSYTSDTGVFVHGAFSAILATTDKVQLIHPMLYHILTIRGGTNTIQDLKDWQDANLDLARSTQSGTKSFTAAGGEQNAYEESDTHPFRVDKLLIDLTGANFGSGNIVVRLYKKVKSGGNYHQAWIATYAATPASALVEIGNQRDADNDEHVQFPLYNMYGVKVTVDVADNQNIDCEFWDSIRSA